MITIIAAMTYNHVIGNNGKLPWHIPDELKFFRSTTRESTVIMGIRTFESIGRPLPYRHNIVLSSQQRTIMGVATCTTIEQSLTLAHSYQKPIFIIGGAQIYRQFLPLSERLVISYIKHDYEGNVFFPEFDLHEWQQTHTQNYHEFDVITYIRK